MTRKSVSQPGEGELIAAVGAVIFASGEPVTVAEIVQAFAGVASEQIESAIDELQSRLVASDAGLRLERVAGGVRLTTRPEVAEWVRGFVQQRNRSRLSPAALETLAVIAYRQPVTAPEIQAIRGKDPSGALKGLLDKKMLRILGKKKVVGSPLLYGTSREFLLHFGLDSLGDLPAMEDFEEFVGTFESAEADFVEQAEGSETDATPPAEAGEGEPHAESEEIRPEPV